MHQPRPDVLELIRGARRVRELIWQDPHRPRYHLVPPEGFFNDPNGALFWNGRYHLFLPCAGADPAPAAARRGVLGGRVGPRFSRDLVHWIQHPPAIRPKPDGATPMGIYSGGAIKNAPLPALILPGQLPRPPLHAAAARADELDRRPAFGAGVADRRPRPQHHVRLDRRLPP